MFSNINQPDVDVLLHRGPAYLYLYMYICICVCICICSLLPMNSEYLEDAVCAYLADT